LPNATVSKGDSVMVNRNPPNLKKPVLNRLHRGNEFPQLRIDVLLSFLLLPWSSAVSPKDSFSFSGSERRTMNQIESVCVDLPLVCISNLKFFSNRHLSSVSLDKHFGFFHPKNSSFHILKALTIFTENLFKYSY
jgi:hypothetical protein